MEYFDEVNESGYGFLTKLKEMSGNRNSLLLNIQAQKKSAKEEYIIISGKSMGPMRRIFTDGTCAKYEIYFAHYISYNVYNESYIVQNEDIYIGTTLRIYSKSKYLDFITEFTTADYIWPGELKHYAVLSQNHVVDIVSTFEPIIKRLR